MNVFLARHGETEENRAGIIQGGRIQGVLSEEGKTQAKNLASILKKERIELIYSSDLARAADTTTIIIGDSSKKNIIFSKKLRERNMSVWEGRKKSDLGLKGYIMGLPATPEGGETLEQLYARASEFVKTLEKKEGNILVVAHNGIIKAIISAMRRSGAEGITKTVDFPNTNIVKTSFDGRTWCVKLP